MLMRSAQSRIRGGTLGLGGECCEDHVCGFLGGVSGQWLAPHDCAHEERSDEQVVDECEVDVGGELATVDSSLEDLPYRCPARRKILAHIGLREVRVRGQVGDEPGRDPATVGRVLQLDLMAL